MSRVATWLSLASTVATLKDASRRRSGGLGPSILDRGPARRQRDIRPG